MSSESEEHTENYSRLNLILVKGGTLLTKKLLKKRATELCPQGNIDAFLKAKKSVIIKRIGKHYEKIVFPANGQTNLNSWDLYLFCSVLLTSCSLERINQLDIDKILKMRNKLFHLHEPIIPSPKYHKKIGKLKLIFKRTCMLIGDSSLEEEMERIVERYENQSISKMDVIQLNHLSNKMEVRLIDIMENPAETIDRIMDQLNIVSARLPPNSHVHTENKLIIEFINCPVDKEEQLSILITGLFMEKISGEHIESRIKQSVTEDVFRKLNHVVLKIFEKLASKGWHLTNAESKCILLTISCDTLSSFIQLMKDCLNGSIFYQFHELRTAIRMVEGCGEVTFLTEVYEDQILTSVAEVVGTLESFVQETNDVHYVCDWQSMLPEPTRLKEPADLWGQAKQLKEDVPRRLQIALEVLPPSSNEYSDRNGENTKGPHSSLNSTDDKRFTCRSENQRQTSSLGDSFPDYTSCDDENPERVHRATLHLTNSNDDSGFFSNVHQPAKEDWTGIETKMTLSKVMTNREYEQRTTGETTICYGRKNDNLKADDTNTGSDNDDLPDNRGVKQNESSLSSMHRRSIESLRRNETDTVTKKTSSKPSKTLEREKLTSVKLKKVLRKQRDNLNRRDTDGGGDNDDNPDAGGVKQNLNVESSLTTLRQRSDDRTHPTDNITKKPSPKEKTSKEDERRKDNSRKWTQEFREKRNGSNERDTNDGSDDDSPGAGGVTQNLKTRDKSCKTNANQHTMNELCRPPCTRTIATQTDSKIHVQPIWIYAKHFTGDSEFGENTKVKFEIPMAGVVKKSHNGSSVHFFPEPTYEQFRKMNKNKIIEHLLDETHKMKKILKEIKGLEKKKVETAEAFEKVTSTVMANLDKITASRATLEAVAPLPLQMKVEIVKRSTQLLLEYFEILRLLREMHEKSKDQQFGENVLKAVKRLLDGMPYKDKGNQLSDAVASPKVIVEPCDVTQNGSSVSTTNSTKLYKTRLVVWFLGGIIAVSVMPGKDKGSALGTVANIYAVRNTERELDKPDKSFVTNRMPEKYYGRNNYQRIKDNYNSKTEYSIFDKDASRFYKNDDNKITENRRRKK